MPNRPSHLGEKLREAMRLRDVTQAEVARAFQVAPPTVSSDWLKHGRIGKKHYPKLVEFFRLPYDWWFNDGGTQAPVSYSPSQPPSTPGQAVAEPVATRWPTAGEKLGTLFDSMDATEQRAAWPWVVRMLCKSPGLLKTYLPFPSDNNRVASAYNGKTPRAPRKGTKVRA